MMHIFSLLVFVIVAYAVVPGLVLAGSGFYVSSEIGANFASGIDTTGFSNDRATVCDEFINPDFREVPPTVANCTGPGRGVGDDWKNDFDGATGILTGAAVGYSFSETYSDRPWGGLRVELEYFYRESKYDEASDIHGALGESRNILEQELVAATERIDGITSHNLFGNLFLIGTMPAGLRPISGLGPASGLPISDMDSSGRGTATRSASAQVRDDPTWLKSATIWPERPPLCKLRSAIRSSGSRCCLVWITR